MKTTAFFRTSKGLNFPYFGYSGQDSSCPYENVGVGTRFIASAVIRTHLLNCIIVSAALAILLIFTGTAVAQSQEVAIEEAEYWLRLARSDEALNNLPPGDAVRELRTLWQGVTAVRLADGTIMKLDTAWLQPDPSAFTETEAAVLQNRIRALIAFQAQRSGLSTEELLARLKELMKDYQYQQRQPRQTTTNTGSSPSGPSVPLLPVELVQGLLMIIGMIAALFIVFYFARSLRLQAAGLDSDKNKDDIPATSAAADELAEESEASRDYRAAIRYLYLSSLLLLDERGVINFDPNLTNLEHLRQVRNRPQLNDLLTSIVNVFDHVWYGFAPVDEGMYRTFRDNVDQLKEFQT